MSQSEFKQERRHWSRSMPSFESETRFNLVNFVDMVADFFEQFSPGHSRISKAARQEIVASMVPHIKELRNDLSQGTMTKDELASILLKVLSKAQRLKSSRQAIFVKSYAIVRPRKPHYVTTPPSSAVIGQFYVRRAMKTECHYLGWC